MATRPSFTLSAKEVSSIKRMLFEGGKTQEAIGEEWSVSQATISRIVTGKQYADIPWPDKSIGPIEPARWRGIVRRNRKKIQEKPGAIEGMRRAVFGKKEPDPVEQEGEKEEEAPIPQPENWKDTDGQPPVPQIYDVGAAIQKVTGEQEETEERKGFLETIDALEEGLIIEREGELQGSIADVGETVEWEEAEEKPTIYEEMEWGDIRSAAPKNDLVLLAEEEEDNEILKKAICIVFKVVPPEQWGDDNTVSAVKNTMAILQNKQNE